MKARQLVSNSITYMQMKTRWHELEIIAIGGHFFSLSLDGYCWLNIIVNKKKKTVNLNCVNGNHVVSFVCIIHFHL